MSQPARPASSACTECRLGFPSPRALHRHTVLDHRPAPDGAHLTALLVAGRASELEAAVTAGDERAAAAVLPAPGTTSPAVPAPTPPPARPEAAGRHVAVLLVVGLVALLLGHEPLVALGSAVLAWALCLARSSLDRLRPRSRRPHLKE